MSKPHYANHDLAVRDLRVHNSLDALAFLLEQGRELEFTFQEKSYFLSLFHSQKHVSLWCCGTEQPFENFKDLTVQATLDGIPFLTAWEQVHLDYLF